MACVHGFRYPHLLYIYKKHTLMDPNQQYQQQPPPPNYPPPPQAADNGKTVAILAYVTLIGFIIAIIMHTSGTNKTRLGAFHLRQALGLFIMYIAGLFLLMIISMVMWFLWALIPIWGLCAFVFLILGIVNAANGQEKPIPLIGGLSEKMLGNAFN